MWGGLVKRSVVVSGDSKSLSKPCGFFQMGGLPHSCCLKCRVDESHPSALTVFASSEDAADAFDAVKPKLGVISHDHHERGPFGGYSQKIRWSVYCCEGSNRHQHR